MGEISMFGSGEGLVWVTGRGYSTTLDLADRAFLVASRQNSKSRITALELQLATVAQCLGPPADSATGHRASTGLCCVR